MKAAVVSEQGARPEMEDFCFLDLDFAGRGWVYAGVYDGHGGKYAARYASQKLHEVFLSALLSGLTPQRAFVKAYETISNQMKDQGSGATAVDLLIREGRVYVANAGDARAIVVSHKGVRQLSVDHRLDMATERERIVKMGGLISYPYTRRGVNGLMPTRTLGDEYFKAVGIIATPDVREYEVARDDLVVLAASDGLFDVVSNQEAADFARRIREPERLARALTREALLKRFSGDNLTIAVVALQEDPPEAASHGRIAGLRRVIARIRSGRIIASGSGGWPDRPSVI